jgi:hypothetical protein
MAFATIKSHKQTTMIGRKIATNYSVRRDYALMKIIPLFAVLILCVSGCGSHTIDEQKVIGAWQLDVPSKYSQVFTFNADHTYTIGDPNKPKLPTLTYGYWRLNGNRLTTDMRILATNDLIAKSEMTNEKVS